MAATADRTAAPTATRDRFERAIEAVQLRGLIAVRAVAPDDDPRRPEMGRVLAQPGRR